MSCKIGFSRVRTKPHLLKNYKTGDFFDVMLAEIFSPSNFYVQVINVEDLYDLDELLDDMEDVYSVDYEDRFLYLPPDQLREDLHCAVKLRDDKKWYRATISGLQEEIVSVFLLDFGTTAVLPCSYSHIRQLMPRFSSVLPAQAVKARLAHIAPPLGSGGLWTESSSELLLELAARASRRREDREMVGLVARMEGWGEDGVPVVTLFDTVTNSLHNGLDLGMVLVKEGEARTLDREEKPCLRQDFPKVEEELGEESLFTYLEHLLGVQFKILNTMSQLGTSEKENKIVFEMTELHQKYRKLIEEMYDLQFEKMKEVEISEIVGNSNMVDTSNKVVVKDKTFGGDNMEISSGIDDNIKISSRVDDMVELTSGKVAMEMVFEAVEDSAKITCDAENTVESLNGVDEREQISGGIEDRIDVSNRIQMETSSGVKSRLEIVPTNVAMFSTIKEEECRLINPEHNAITIDNSVKREHTAVMTTVLDIGKLGEGQIVPDSKLNESRYGDTTEAWKGRLVSRLQLSDVLIHLVTWKEHIWVISAEISNLKPVWRGYDLVNTVLKYRPVNFQMETIVAAEEEELWQELVMAEVGGLLDRKGKLVPTLNLYRFIDLFDILEALNVDLDMLDMETMKVALQSVV